MINRALFAAVMGCLSLLTSLLSVPGLHAQTFVSGSTGADGVLHPTAHTTLTLPPDGIFNFTTITIPSGVTVTFTRNAANTPVTLLATGDVTISGTISVNGGAGANPSTTASGFHPGGVGGPGGFNGGNGGTKDGLTLPANGLGPGGGLPATTTAAGAGSFGVQASFVSLLPLFGGSGGGGGQGNGTFNGGAGGGGGGAMVIASSTKITVSGALTAQGGNAGAVGFCVVTSAGNGSGGAIRLVAPEITGGGSLNALGGAAPSGCGATNPGRIRLEAFTLGFTGTSTPPFSPSGAPGPVTTTSNPAVTDLPTVTLTVGGVVSPPNPGGAYSTADIALPQGTTNPVSVTLTSTKIPAPRTFIVRLVPQFGSATTFNVTTSGTFDSASVTFNVTFPTGEVSVLNAKADFTLPLVAGLFPDLDGEAVDRVMLAAALGGPSRLSLVTASGRTVPVEELPLPEQRQVARAFELAAALSD